MSIIDRPFFNGFSGEYPTGVPVGYPVGIFGDYPGIELPFGWQTASEEADLIMCDGDMDPRGVPFASSGPCNLKNNIVAYFLNLLIFTCLAGVVVWTVVARHKRAD